MNEELNSELGLQATAHLRIPEVITGRSNLRWGSTYGKMLADGPERPILVEPSGCK